MIEILNKQRGGVGEYIGRGSPLGNPFKLRSAGGQFERDESIQLYEAWINEKIASKDPAVCKALNRLWLKAKQGDVALVCFCKPLACHGDVIKKILESKL